MCACLFAAVSLWPRWAGVYKVLIRSPDQVPDCVGRQGATEADPANFSESTITTKTSADAGQQKLSKLIERTRPTALRRACACGFTENGFWVCGKRTKRCQQSRQANRTHLMSPA